MFNKISINKASLNKRVTLSVLVLMFLMVAVSQTVFAALDPTRPPGMNMKTAPTKNVKKKGPRWVLKSTLVSMERRTAVINNRVVSKGDRINGATVISIQSSRVRLRASGRDITLVMLSKDVKTLSK